MRNLLLCVSALLVAGCFDRSLSGPKGPKRDGSVDLTPVPFDATPVLQADARVPYTFSVGSSGTEEISVSCQPQPMSPDDVGPLFALELDGAPDTALGLNAAGEYRTVAPLSPGSHTLTVIGQSEMTCSVTFADAAAGCTRSRWHTPEVGHTHIAVGTDPDHSDRFASSGDHWGAWAPWGVTYEKPVWRGFFIHGLEHGGIVLSYGCASADESAACKTARDNLVSLQQMFGQHRVLITPDPNQPQLYGVRTWRWAYSSDCFVADEMLGFMTLHFRNGRENIDGDVPIPFDPTTTNVPCQDIMGAPDSC